MTRIFKTLLCCLALLLFSSESGFACTCVKLPNVAEDFQDADAVFLGRVVDVSRFGFGTKLRVEQSWKGVSVDEITIFTSNSSCGYLFEKGERYLVYAHKSSDGEYYTGACSGTTNVGSAGESLAFLQGKATLPLTPAPKNYWKVGLTTALFVSLFLATGFLLRLLVRMRRAA